MRSWEIIKNSSKEGFGLYIRDYSCQGQNPDYILFKNITEETALDLVIYRLAGDLYGVFDLKTTAKK